MDEYTIASTSRDSAVCDPLPLRTGNTNRLVFKPLLVNSARDKEAAIKGTFIYQRKGPNDEWEDVEAINLSTLKKGEGVKLPLNTDEVLALFRQLAGVYALHSKDGIPPSATVYLKTDAAETGSLEISADDLRQLVQVSQSAGAEVLGELLEWALQTDEVPAVLDKLKSLDVTSLRRLNALSGVSALRRAIDIWNANQDNDDEEFWQKTLSENAFVFSQVFSFPVIILSQKAYVGGKGISNSGGNLVDYLIANDLTRNTALVEIKTPATRLLGGKYRANAYSPSPDLSGSIVQVQGYRDSFLKEYSRLICQSDEDFQACEPVCVVVAGHTAEMDSANKLRSFELFRAGVGAVRVVTYDELFAKVESLADLIEGV